MARLFELHMNQPIATARKITEATLEWARLVMDRDCETLQLAEQALARPRPWPDDEQDI